jgi:hypothetical protein
MMYIETYIPARPAPQCSIPRITLAKYIILENIAVVVVGG